MTGRRTRPDARTARSRQYADDLAYVHHTGFADLARGAARFLAELLAPAGDERPPYGSRRSPPGKRVVDLGCGSGIVLRALTDAGHEAHGVDLSPAMIALAKRTAPRARVIVGSVYDAPLPKDCDAIFAVGEPLNYVEPSGRAPAVGPLFRKVARALTPGGIFVFDVIVRGRRSLSRRGFTAGEDWATLVDTRDDGATLTRDITTFRKVGARYARSHEIHHVRVFDARALSRQLRALGFRVRTSTRYGAHPLALRRRAFICVKR